jgi:phage shock protein A
MTPAELHALSTTLTYLSSLIVDIRKDVKSLTRYRTREAQQLRRLRESNAKLRADLRRLQSELSELHSFHDPHPTLLP